MASDQTETRSERQPLPEQYDRLRDSIWPRADALSDRPLEFFPGSTVGERDVLSSYAHDMTRGLGGVDYTDAAKDMLGSVMGGDYVGVRGSNPLLDDRFNVMADRVGESFNRITAPSTATRFAGAGRSGSGAYNAAMDQNQRQLGRTLGELATNVYYDDYNRRIDDQFKALGLTPSIRNLDYGDIGQMRAQAGIEEAYDQRLVDDRVARFNFAQQEPESRLDRYLARIIQPGGYGITTETMTSPNTTGLALGLGAMGLAGTLGGAALMPAPQVFGGGTLGAGNFFG